MLKSIVKLFAQGFATVLFLGFLVFSFFGPFIFMLSRFNEKLPSASPYMALSWFFLSLLVAVANSGAMMWTLTDKFKRLPNWL